MIRTTAISACLILAAACGSELPASDPLSITGVHIVDPAGGRDVATGGMEITAHNGNYRLVAASTDAAEHVELHTHAATPDGIMQMRQVEGFDIAEGETLVFQSGGNHLMLFGFEGTLEPGDTTKLTLTFTSDGAEDLAVTLDAPIVSLDHSSHGS